MYEQNGDGTIHGQCELQSLKAINCENTFFTSDWIIVYLHCWQS